MSSYAIGCQWSAIPVVQIYALIYCVKKPNFLGSKYSLFICTAKLQKVVEMAKYFLEKLSTNFHFGKLFDILKILKF